MTGVRGAVEDDTAQLVRLRALLFETLGGDFFNPSAAENSWRETLAAVLKEQLAGDTMRILVVDGDDGLAACGIGLIVQSLPSPHLHNGRIGQVIGMVTDPAYRRRGHSRAIMHGLLNWFREREVARVDLHASSDAEKLYRALGFVDYPDPSLYWRP